ncbi:MAG TPA: hypothetical protein VFW05_00745 [Verrucomicrobiae bacterium]|nr:hypothetical protein [Verrucomicrobiae bacterium]
MGLEVITGGIEVAGKLFESFGSVIGRRINIKELKKSNDRHIDDILDLYERIFKAEHKIPGSDLIAWLQTRDTTEPAEERIQQCLLFAKRKSAVVGVLKALYCPQSRYVLVSYLGIDKQSDTVSRKVARKMMISFFARFLNRKWKDYRGIVFEIETALPGMVKAEKDECRARLRLFRDIATQQNSRALHIKMDYHQPKMADEENYTGTGRKMTLMFIPKKHSGDFIAKAIVENLLKFLLFRVYGTTQTISGRRKEAYGKYLNGIYKLTVNQLTEHVDVE